MHEDTSLLSPLSILKKEKIWEMEESSLRRGEKRALPYTNRAPRKQLSGRGCHPEEEGGGGKSSSSTMVRALLADQEGGNFVLALLHLKDSCSPSSSLHSRILW